MVLINGVEPVKKKVVLKIVKNQKFILKENGMVLEKKTINTKDLGQVEK